MSEMTPVPAATVVVARDAAAEQGIEVLLLRRNSKLVFHGGHWVFPGGRIDAADFEEPAGSEYAAAVRAAVRETQEEAGLVIAPEQLVHTAHWTTPPSLPRRFCTWFFMCALDRDVEVTVDNQEILEHRWLSPSAALRAAKAEELVLPQPTKETLKQIAEQSCVADLMNWARNAPVQPCLLPRDNGIVKARVKTKAKAKVEGPSGVAEEAVKSRVDLRNAHER